MRQAVIASSIVHVALLVVLFAVRVSPAIVMPGDAINVSLVDPGALRPQPPAPQPEPEPKHVTKAPAIKPQEDLGVKLSPPKPKPKPKTKEPVEEPKPVEPQVQQMTLPYQAVGSSGLRGAVSVDQANFEFTYYLLLVRNRVAQAWSPPAGLVTRGKQVQAVVYFRIGRNGSVSAVRLEQPSGFEFFDRSAVRAVTISNPLPPLPLGFSASDLGVHFGFEYATP